MLSSPYSISIFGNIVAAGLFVLLVGLVREPARQRTMAVMAAVAGGLYFQGGLGLWELPLGLAVIVFAYKGLTAYWGIGMAWMLHAVSDLVHHLAGVPMVPTMPLSSFGCLIFDPLIALWFFAGAPSILSTGTLRWRRPASGLR